MAEPVDAADLKSEGLEARVGSSPTFPICRAASGQHVLSESAGELFGLADRLPSLSKQIGVPNLLLAFFLPRNTGIQPPEEVGRARDRRPWPAQEIRVWHELDELRPLAAALGRALGSPKA